MSTGYSFANPRDRGCGGPIDVLAFSRTGCAVLFSATFAETLDARRSTGSRLSEQGAPHELVAINQYWLHYRILDNRGTRPPAILVAQNRRRDLRLAILLLAFIVSPAAPIRLTIGARPPALPSSIAICSDAELRTLAIERNRAFVEAEARLSPEQQKALLADQNDWVRSYTRVCGLSDTPPALTLAPEVKACMARAGSARIAYLRAYGSIPPRRPWVRRPLPSHRRHPRRDRRKQPTRIGPSFDCSKASPLALMICASPALSKVDLRFVQAYERCGSRWGRTGNASSCGKPSISRTRCCAPAASLKRGRSRDRRSASPLNTSGNVRSGSRD